MRHLRVFGCVALTSLWLLARGPRRGDNLVEGTSHGLQPSYARGPHRNRNIMIIVAVVVIAAVIVLYLNLTADRLPGIGWGTFA
jgi:hypothetical protein